MHARRSPTWRRIPSWKDASWRCSSPPRTASKKKVSGTEETEIVEVDVATEPVSADVPEAVVVSEPKAVTYTHVDVLL